MAIEKVTLYYVSCDTCGEMHEWHPDVTKSYMIQIARDNGWGIKLGRGNKVEYVACPEHNDFGE